MWKSGIRRKAGFLAAAGLLDYALQLEMPVILVRRLTTQEFGDYCLVWLVAETGLILFPPRSLYSFSCRAPLLQPAQSWSATRSQVSSLLGGSRFCCV